MSHTVIPTHCTGDQINEGLLALLSKVGVQAADELTIESVEVAAGVVTLSFWPSNKAGDSIMHGRETFPLSAKISVWEDE